MQIEKPSITKEQLATALDISADEAIVSGGMIENFREGWAVSIMSSGNVAHYYRRNRFDKALALCGKLTEARWIYGAGNFPRCKSCKRKKR